MQAKLVNSYIPPQAPTKSETPKGPETLGAQPVTPVAKPSDPTTSATPKQPGSKTDSFDKELDSLIKSDDPAVREVAIRRQLSRSIRRSTGAVVNGSVSEEALFAGMMGLKLLETSGRDAYVQFTDRVRQLTSTSETGGSAEQAAKKALKEVVSAKDASKIYSEAFAASQLDDKSNALFDSIGGKRDRTVAVATFKAAIDSGTANMTKIEAGELEAPLRDIDEIPLRQARKK